MQEHPSESHHKLKIPKYHLPITYFSISQMFSNFAKNITETLPPVVKQMHINATIHSPHCCISITSIAEPFFQRTLKISSIKTYLSITHTVQGFLKISTSNLATNWFRKLMIAYQSAANLGIIYSIRFIWNDGFCWNIIIQHRTMW